MSEHERALLMAWWDSDWPDDASHVIDGLAGVLDQIIDARLGSGEVVDRVREALDRSGAWSIEAHRDHVATAAVEAVRAALKDSPPEAAPVPPLSDYQPRVGTQRKESQ